MAKIMMNIMNVHLLKMTKNVVYAKIYLALPIPNYLNSIVVRLLNYVKFTYSSVVK